jgi:hypothetical protein
MFRHQIAHFTIAGFEIKIDASWLFMALLIAWSRPGLLRPLFRLPPVVYCGWEGWRHRLFQTLVFHCSAIAGCGAYGLPIRGHALPVHGVMRQRRADD